MSLTPTETAASTFLLLGGGVFVLLAGAVFLGRAAALVETEGDGRRSWTVPLALMAVMAAWFGFAITVVTAGSIEFQVLIPSALVPIVVGTALTFLPRVADLLRQVPTHWLVYLQFYRVLGALFIVPYLTSGLLTQGFALNAGIGDIITGVLAVPVAWLVHRDGRRWTWVFLAWTAFGIADLIVAPLSAATFGFEAAGADPAFPITLIPMFFGPPFGILIHLVTLRCFWLQHRGARAEGALPAPAGAGRVKPVGGGVA